MAGGIPRAEPPPEEPPRVMLWRWRPNPLRRPADRLQAWIGLGLLLAVLATGVPVVFLAGDTAHRHYTQTAELQARTRHHIAAVLVQAAPGHLEPGSDEAKQTTYPIPVRFTDTEGRTRTEKAHVQPGLPAGSTIQVWINGDGHVTEPPMTGDQIRSRTMGWALVAALAVALVGATAYGAATLALRRRNLDAWDAAWARTAPRWTAPS